MCDWTQRWWGGSGVSHETWADVGVTAASLTLEHQMNIIDSKAFIKRENIWSHLPCNVSFEANGGIRVEKSFLFFFFI